MAYPLPNGKTQFLSATGAPYAGGSVYHYIPATGTLKDTYQDSAATILNTNPVILDASGEAVILGVGSYRQVLFDSIGNQIWDQVTLVPGLSDLGAMPVAGGTFTGAVTVPSESNTGAQLLAITPTANTQASQASLNVQGATNQSGKKEILAAFGFTVSTGSASGSGNQNKVGVFSGVNAIAGGGDVWAIQAATTTAATYGANNAISVEIDLNNNTAERGATLGAGGLASPVAYGLAITGAGAYRSTAAMVVTGPGTAIWNRGIVFAATSVSQATIQDLSSSTISVEIQGAHTYGIDMRTAAFSQAAIRLPNNNSIVGRKADDSSDIRALRVDTANYIRLGETEAAGIIMTSLQASTTYANDAAAAAGGVPIAGLYRNGSVVQIRIV